MTYQEVNDRLTRVQTALQSLQDGSYANNTSINVPQMTSQLQEVESKLKEQLAVIAEQEKGMVATDDETQAEKLAKKGVNVKLTKEERGEARFNVDETKEIAKEVGKAVAKALKTAGDEIAHMKATDIEESSFEIQVEFKDGELDQYSFYVDGEELHLVDFSFDKVVGDIGIKPSGEPIVHVDVIANNLVKHFRSTMKEGNEGDNYTLFLDMFKRLKKKLPPHHPQYKEMLAKVKKAMDQKGIDSSMIQEMSDEEFADAQEKQRLDKDPEKSTIEKIQALIAAESVNKENKAHDDGGDLDIGHQDDEPDMLKQYAYDIATYAAKLYKQLDKYDKMDAEVDFPNWWQSKVILAREYISKAQHYLEFEEKQPAIDQLALEESKLKDKVDEIGMFNDPVGYEKSKPEKPTYTKKFVSKNVYDIFKNGKKVKTIKGAEGEANAWMNNALKGQKNEGVGKSLADLKMGEKFTFNGKEFTFIELYPELPNAARVVLPDGRKTVVSFGGGKVNTGKKADIGPDAFGQGKGHHIDEAQSTCCGKCGRKHVKGTKCKTPYLKGKDHCRTR